MTPASSVRQIATGLLVGVIIGGGLGVGWRGLRSDPTPVTATTISPAPVVVEAPWIEGGIRFLSTVLVPQALVVGDGVASLEYRLDTIGPRLAAPIRAENGAPPIDVAVRPDRWELETAAGTTIEATTPFDATEVRFDLPEGTVRADIAVVRVVGWRQAVPLGASAALSVETGATGTLVDGTVVTVDLVLPQSNATIVGLVVMPPDDPWHREGSFGFAAADPGWRLSQTFRELQFIWEGGDAPNGIEIVAQYPLWLPVAETVVIVEGSGS